MRRLLLVALLTVTATVAPAVAERHVCGTLCDRPPVECPNGCPDLPRPDGQFDGDGHGDASDSCAGATTNVPPGSSTSGTLTPPDTDRDFYLLPIPAGYTSPVTVTATELADATPYTEWALYVNVWTPACDAHVEGTHYDQGLGVACTYVQRRCVPTPVAQGDVFVFTPPAGGEYRIEVFAVIDQEPIVIHPPRTLTCDPVCSRVVNTVGYRITVS